MCMSFPFICVALFFCVAPVRCETGIQTMATTKTYPYLSKDAFSMPEAQRQNRCRKLNFICIYLLTIQSAIDLCQVCPS